MPPLTPWLQRLLIAWAASAVSTGVILSTADNRHRPKKARNPKKRRRRELDNTASATRARPPVLPGTVAKADAALPFTPSLTWAGWATDVRARGRRLLRFVTGQAPEGRVDEHGSRLPDEIVTADGKKVRVAGVSPKSKKTAGHKGAPPARRRRGRKQQASLFDSAKESLRQVVKEEAKKAVDEKVEEAGLKKAADAIKSAGEKVGETAKDVAQRVKDSMPDDVEEKLQSAGRSMLAEARRAMQRLSDSIQGSDDGHGVASASVSPPDTVDQVADPGAALPPAGGPGSANDAALAASPPPPSLPGPASTVGGDEAERASSSSGDIASALGDGVQLLGGGVQKIGSFLSGPGNPGYHRSSGRARAASGDIVEAKDAPTHTPTPSTVAPPPTAPDGPRD
jgi:hypothetical protein